MHRLFKFSDYALLSLNLLLCFFLLFEEKVQLPFWLSPIGRMHPLLLHLPIGFVVLLVIFQFFKKDFDSTVYGNIIKLLMTITALSAVVVAIMGFFLSREGGFDSNMIQNHKWTGVGVSFVCYLIYLFYSKINFAQKGIGAWLLIGMFALASHFGANITHGQNYLFEAFEKQKAKPQFTEKNTIYEAAIMPILEAKCMVCHNDQKAKGQLNMSSIQNLLKGGKNGPIWKAGDALNSHIVQRATLPEDDKKHMPPTGKPQLSNDEIALITAWISEGADIKKSFISYPDSSGAKRLASKFINSKDASQPTKVYTFGFASESVLKEVNTPYCTVFQLSTGSPALQADFFVSKKFDRKSLENLSKVKDQLVALNLSKMPIKDEDLSLISVFPNLEKLILNQTDITGATLAELKKCKNLSSVALAGTSITKSNLEKLLDLPSLREVFVWNTAIDEATVSSVTKKYPKLVLNRGAIDDPNEMLKLNPPILVNEAFVIKGNTPITLKHTLKNIKIHYTLDGSEPDSTGGTIYDKPIIINGFTTLKAIATKPNWYASNKVEYTFYKAGFTPDSAYLLTLPNPKNAGKGITTLIDLKKGAESYQDPTWLGFRENNLIAVFSFNTSKSIKEITISYLQKMDSFILPPASVEVWAGDNPKAMKLIKKHIPQQPQKMEPNKPFALNIPLPSSMYKNIKLIINPVQKLPVWHPGKGQKAWIFTDEIFFN